MMGKITVIIATYNGERFIIEQLDSINRQTRKVNNVIICDDISTDATVDLCNLYIKEHEVTGWVVYKNKKNKGYKNNFIDLIRLAVEGGSEYIFLADQDDIWMDNRIELMVGEMEKNRNINLLACNVKPFYTSPYANKVRFASLSNKRLSKIGFAAYWLFAQRPGCSYLISDKLGELMINLVDEGRFSNKNYAHDCILWSLALLEDKAYLLNEDLLYFRRHGNNSSNSNKTTRNSRLIGIDNEISICNEILEMSLAQSNFILPIYQAFISRQLNFLLKRKRALAKRGTARLFKLLMLGFGMRYYPRKRNFLGDIIYAMLPPKKSINY